MYAYQAVLEALLLRGRTGEGSALATSLFRGMADWMTVPLLHQDYGPAAPPRVAPIHLSLAPHAVYACKRDGAHVSSIQLHPEETSMVEEMQMPPTRMDDPPSP